MAWVKIDDQAPRHPKMLAAGPSACWLWVCALAYAQSQLTDGFVPEAALPFMGVPRGPSRSLAETLVTVGLFERADGGYRIHDYFDYNKDAATVREHREKVRLERQRAGRRGGLKSVAMKQAKSKQTTNGLLKQTSSKPVKQTSSPIPSHPIRTKKRTGTSRSGSLRQGG